MPTRRRHEHDDDLCIEQARERARWGGGLPGISELTDEQRQTWNVYRRSQADWVPHRALIYAWMRVDPVHGTGGTTVSGRPRRPDDPGGNDGWCLDRFLALLEADRTEIAAVVADHPAQAGRLMAWAQHLERLGRERDAAIHPRVGYFYEQLMSLGYSGSEMTEA